MAAQTCAHAQTATLSTTVADLITFTGSHRSLVVTNHDGTEKLYFRPDATTAVAAADENFVVLPGKDKTITPFGGPKCSVVGSGNVYTVEAW